MGRAHTHQTNGVLAALNGLFQTARRRARGFKRLATIQGLIFLIPAKLDFHAINLMPSNPLELQLSLIPIFPSPATTDSRQYCFVGRREQARLASADRGSHGLRV